MEPKYPEVEVQLTGRDGNAGSIMGTVVRALQKHLREIEMDPEEIRVEIQAFREECMSGDYDHLLRTCLRWVDVG